MVARLGFQRLCPASQPSSLWHLSCVCQPLTHNERRGARRAGETQRDPVCLQPLEAHLEQQSIKLILLPLFVWPRSCFIICPLLASSSSRLSHDSSCPSLLDVSLTSFDPVSHSVSSFFSLFPSPSLCLSPLPSLVLSVSLTLPLFCSFFFTFPLPLCPSFSFSVSLRFSLSLSASFLLCVWPGLV